MLTQYQILTRQKRAKGFLDKGEQVSLEDAKLDERVRRWDALYGSGLLSRRLAQLGCAIRGALKPQT